MKNMATHFLLLVCVGLFGCAANESAYNASTYLMNKECKTSDSCTGSIQGTYRQNEKSQEEYKRALSSEENERLKRAKEDLEKKKSVEAKDKSENKN